MTGIPGLSHETMAHLAALLEPLRQGRELFLFGSRARGEHRTFSDVDILVQGNEPVPFEILAQVESELEESTLPISVDVIDAQRASKDFLKAIERDRRLLTFPTTP